MLLYTRAAIWFLSEGTFMCSRNLGLLLSILCVRSKESRCAMNVVSSVISFLWLLLIGGDCWAGDCSQPCPIKVPLSGKVIAVVAFALVRW